MFYFKSRISMMTSPRKMYIYCFRVKSTHYAKAWQMGANLPNNFYRTQLGETSLYTSASTDIFLRKLGKWGVMACILPL